MFLKEKAQGNEVVKRRKVLNSQEVRTKFEMVPVKPNELTHPLILA